MSRNIAAPASSVKKSRQTLQTEAVGSRHRYSDALSVIEDALSAHYKTGDYVRLGMALQDVATEVLVALRLTISLEDLHASL